MLANVLRRVRLWWAVQCDIEELTRDHDRDTRAHAAAAVHLDPGPPALFAMFRSAAASPRGHGSQSDTCPDCPCTARGEK